MFLNLLLNLQLINKKFNIYQNYNYFIYYILIKAFLFGPFPFYLLKHLGYSRLN